MDETETVTVGIRAGSCPALDVFKHRKGRLLARHRDAIDTYLVARELKVAEVRTELEARFPPEGIRSRLLARQANTRGSTQ